MKMWDAHGAHACGAGTLLEAPLQPCLRLGARVSFPPPTFSASSPCGPPSCVPSGEKTGWEVACCGRGVGGRPPALELAGQEADLKS